MIAATNSQASVVMMEPSHPGRGTVDDDANRAPECRESLPAGRSRLHQGLNESSASCVAPARVLCKRGLNDLRLAVRQAGQDLVSLMREHLEMNPDLAGLTDGETKILQTALAKDPRRRHATCARLVEALMQTTATGQ